MIAIFGFLHVVPHSRVNCGEHEVAYSRTGSPGVGLSRAGLLGYHDEVSMTLCGSQGPNYRTCSEALSSVEPWATQSIPMAKTV